MNLSQDLNLVQLRELLRIWDGGVVGRRKAILKEFLQQCSGMTAMELEKRFSDASSLFFLRLTSCLRLSYFGSPLFLDLLTSIQQFLTAVGGYNYIVEFLQIGGIQTLIDSISIESTNESDKRKALSLLHSIGSNGIKYKILICKQSGIREVAEFLAFCEEDETALIAGEFFEMLMIGNSEYHMAIYKGLVAVLPSQSPLAQECAVRVLRKIQPIVKRTIESIAEPLIDLLATYHPTIKYEVIELLRDLIPHSEVRYSIIELLVQSISKKMENDKFDENIFMTQPDEVSDDKTLDELRKSYISFYIKQANCIECILLLIKDNLELIELFIKKKLLHHLFIALGTKSTDESSSTLNEHTAEIRYYSGLCISYILKADVNLMVQVREHVGNEFVDKITMDTENIYTSITNVEYQTCSSNRLEI
ncbi:hypothetical protein SNEBB_002760 [Seison nebaliae]|nr:hypothetical protein SNEBB_002760 [Seison nebaliae]